AVPAATPTQELASELKEAVSSPPLSPDSGATSRASSSPSIVKTMEDKAKEMPSAPVPEGAAPLITTAASAKPPRPVPPAPEPTEQSVKDISTRTKVSGSQLSSVLETDRETSNFAAGTMAQASSPAPPPTSRAVGTPPRDDVAAQQRGPTGPQALV